MRTLRAALASTTPLVSPRLYELTVLTVRLPETGVRHQPKLLYVFNRFWLYDVGRFSCTTPAETTARFRPSYTAVYFGRNRTLISE